MTDKATITALFDEYLLENRPTVNALAVIGSTLSTDKKRKMSDQENSSDKKLKRRGKRNPLSVEEEAEKKEHRRMQNRRAAQTSREKKQQQLLDLEAKVQCLLEERKQLEATVKCLQAENEILQSASSRLSKDGKGGKANKLAVKSFVPVPLEAVKSFVPRPNVTEINSSSIPSVTMEERADVFESAVLSSLSSRASQVPTWSRSRMSSRNMVSIISLLTSIMAISPSISRSTNLLSYVKSGIYRASTCPKSFHRHRQGVSPCSRRISGLRVFSDRSESPSNFRVRARWKKRDL